jgi:LacI family transcriptional regulator
MMTIRLKDIARELDVSIITVSKAIRGAKDISEKTRQRILKRIKELDYQPNLAARSLATGRSFLIGLIVPNLLNPLFTELATSLGRFLRREPYDLIIASSGDDPEVEKSGIRMMLARSVDALLIASCQSKLDGFLSVHNQQTPFALIDRPFPHLRANFIGTDDCLGGKFATEHLIQLGRKRLAYIGSPDLGPAADRFRGFRMALRDHEIDLREDLVLSSPDGEEPGDNIGYGLMQVLLRRKPRPDGVFCHNDVIAIGAIKAALDAGLSIPGDIAFVGYDNVKYSKYLQIPLTSVDQSTDQLGEAAAQLALDLAAGRIDKPKEILLAPKLVVRESTIGKVQSQTSAASISRDSQHTSPSRRQKKASSKNPVR